MDSGEIILTFDDDGKVDIEAKGFKGRSCKDATEFLEKTLGRCVDFRRKAEWFEQNILLSGHIQTKLCG